jgi:exopolysaccharide biosynthesis polyprenyl glycosylphosphotransferase
MRAMGMPPRSPADRLKPRDDALVQTQKAQERIATLHPNLDSNWYLRYRRQVRLMDMFAVIVSLGISVVVRSILPFTVAATLRIENYIMTCIGLGIGWFFMLSLLKTRRRNVIGTSMAEYQAVIQASVLTFGFAAIVSYAFMLELSRMLFLLALPLGLLMLLVGRWVLRSRLNARRNKQGLALTPTLVVGQLADVDAVVTDMLNTLEAGYWPQAVCVIDGKSDAFAYDIPRVPYDELSSHLKRVGAVIVAGGLDAQQTKQLAWELESSDTELLLRPMLTDIAGPRVSMQVADGLALMHLDLPRFEGYQLVIKRLFDIAVAVLALLLLSPLLLVIAVIIKIDDPKGPIIFTQDRVGLGGKTFRIHKFRSMVVDAEERLAALVRAQGGQQAMFKMKDDPRITRVGRFIRKTSIDELPQFWDVLIGSMSIVGPRPALPQEVATYSQRHLRRLLIKPGITGLWQIRGRSDLSIEESIRLDLRYVENWSLLGDIVIVLKTAMVVLRGSGSY